MQKIRNMVSVENYLRLLTGLCLLASLFQIMAMQRVSHLPVQLPKDTIAQAREKERQLIGFYGSLYSVIKSSPTVVWMAEKLKELVKGKEDRVKSEALGSIKEIEKKANIPSMFSRISKDSSIVAEAKKSRELVMRNPTLRQQVFPPSGLTMSVDAMFGSQESLPLSLLKAKITDYTLRQLVEGINYIKIHYPASDMINQFTAELTSRGYPYDIKGYENNKICESLNPDIQSVLFIEHAISLLKGRIIDKKGAQEMKQLAYKRPGFSFNSLVFSPQSDRLVAVGSDDENNNELILLDCKTDDTFSFKGSINYRKIHLSSVIFTPDGKSMVIAKDDGWLSLITLNSESGSHDFSTERIKVTNSPLLSVALRPNSKQIIVLTTDILCILPMNDTGDIDTSCQIMRARPEDKNFETFAVSSDGKRIAVATNGGLITYAFDSDGNIYRDRNWNFTHGSINILVFTPDNMKLVAGLGPSKKNELNFFQFKDDQLVHTRFDGYYVSGLAFIPNSKKIIIQGYGEKAFSRLILANISEFERRVGIEFGDLYHPSGGIKFKNLDSPGGALSMVASPNGEKIVVGFKGKLIVWNFLSHKDKKLLNDLRVTLTKDQAKLISILLQKINKNDPIKLLPFEMDDYHELPLAVRDLLLGTGDVSNLLSTTRSFDYYAQ